MFASCVPPPPLGEGTYHASPPSIPPGEGEVRGKEKGEGRRKNREGIGAQEGRIGARVLKASSSFKQFSGGINSVRHS